MIWLLFVLWYPGDDAIIVITSKDTQLDVLQLYQLRSLYLGKTDQIKGERLTPCQIKLPKELRNQFEDLVFGPSFDVDLYWVNQGLKGGVKPPLTFHDQAILMAIISRNPGFVGFVHVSQREHLQSFRLKEIVIKD